MPYVNIPDSGLAGGVAKIVGKLSGKISAEVLGKANELASTLNVDGCPKSKSLDRMRSQVSQLQNSLRSIDDRLNKFKKLPKSLKPPLKGLKVALKIILSLPIPQAVPPGVGLPINITTKYADIMHLIKELIKQTDELITSIEAALDTPSSVLNSVLSNLGRADNAVRACEVERSLREGLDNGEIDKKELDDIGLTDGDDFIVSNLGPKLLSGNSNNQTRGKWGIGIDYKKNDIVTNKSFKYICLKDHRSTKETQPPRGPWKLLENATNESLGNLQSAITKLDGSNLPDELKNNLSKLLDSFKPISDADKTNDNRFTYSGPNGEVYFLDIVLDPFSPKIAPRRFAIAKNKDNIIVLKGAKSFSSDINVLLDEIKFRIDNQLP